MFFDVLRVFGGTIIQTARPLSKFGLLYCIQQYSAPTLQLLLQVGVSAVGVWRSQ